MRKTATYCTQFVVAITLSALASCDSKQQKIGSAPGADTPAVYRYVDSSELEPPGEDTVVLINDLDNIDPEKLMTFAETLVGIPYKYASTDPKVGFDCSGFITYVFNHFSAKVPRSSIEFTNVGDVITETEARRGDIILFTGTNPNEKHVGHMGLVTSNDATGLSFIHSTSGKAYSVTVTPLNDYYRTRLVGFRRVFKYGG